MTAMLTRAQYAAEVGASVRAVDRWISAGLLADVAVRQGRSWYIPSGTPRPQPDGSATSRDVAPVAAAATSRDVVVSTAPAESPLGMLGTLEDAAAALGTTVGGVRRMARDGLLVVGPYGRNGALRVYAPPRG